MESHGASARGAGARAWRARGARAGARRAAGQLHGGRLDARPSGGELEQLGLHAERDRRISSGRRPRLPRRRDRAAGGGAGAAHARSTAWRSSSRRARSASSCGRAARRRWRRCAGQRAPSAGAGQRRRQAAEGAPIAAPGRSLKRAQTFVQCGTLRRDCQRLAVDGRTHGYRFRRSADGGRLAPGVRPAPERRRSPDGTRPRSPDAAGGVPEALADGHARDRLLDPHRRSAPAPGDGLAARLRLLDPGPRALPCQRVLPARRDRRGVPPDPVQPDDRSTSSACRRRCTSSRAARAASCS